MKYAVSSWIYGGDNLETIFDRLARYGYDAIELEGEPERIDRHRIINLCRTYKLSVSGIAGMYPWPTEERDLAALDRESRQKAVRYLQSCINYAHDLEAPLVIVVPSAVGKVMPLSILNGDKAMTHWDEEVEQEWNLARDSVHQCVDLALERGVILAVEPINRYETHLVNTCSQAMKFIEPMDKKAVKIHLDTFHMNIEEASIVEAILNAGPMLANLHVADSNRQAVGRGHIDFKAILQALTKINYPGVLSLEPLPPVPNPYVAMKIDRYKLMRDQIARESIEALKSLS